MSNRPIAMVEEKAGKGSFTIKGSRANYRLGIARKYFSPFNLFTLYKAQIRSSLEYCSQIWGAAAPTTLSILDAVQ
nr:unnamed protein product [Callosobruchus chinensis]